MAQIVKVDSWSEDSEHCQGVQIAPFTASDASLKVSLLHGNIEIWVNEGKNLPNNDRFYNKPIKSSRRKRSCNPYVTVSVANAIIGRTYIINNSENPVWKLHFNVPVAHFAAEVYFTVKDNHTVGAQIIGAIGIPVELLISGTKLEGTFPILNESRKPFVPEAVLTLSIQYVPIEKMSLYHCGVGSQQDSQGMYGTYFPLRRGGKVTLYQDAHVLDGCLPNVGLDDDMQLEHRKCWHDVFDAIIHAQRFICITGWSVYHKVRLVRDDDSATESILGDLLRTKSKEGVRVLLLVWNDFTSHSILGIPTVGVMQTHDKETLQFFKHSSVQVLLCPRSSRKGLSWAKKQEARHVYTHHQKTVIVDADAGHNKRKMITFLGGLDLCKGRYDTPKHALFRTLQTVHKVDYYNPNFKGSAVGCPREPWHDLHCQIDGPAARDVYTNFEERWLRVASEASGSQKRKISREGGLPEIDDIIKVTIAPSISEDDPEVWAVQVFRSIDSNSVEGFPNKPEVATSKNLVCGKNVFIDMSIHTAYVKAIRTAQRFIYVENQYFLGSSYNWTNHNDIGANNLIPMEIALKIANKIRANERFSAYIVIPMWPEGVPRDWVTQRILFWQHNTMKMMYEIIYNALEEVGLQKEREPQDYLNFFCLGNREAQDKEDTSDAGNATAKNTPQVLTQKNRRFMIYVHSKGMIVDDEYVIVGSANINQRSLDGTRDTEIAIAAYQPHYTWESKKSTPSGQIYGYRMSLWAEHIGVVEECFKQPESLDCVKRVRTLSELNWKQYAADEVTEMKGHLLKYPVEVDHMGQVKPLPGCEEFPDLGGKIFGSHGGRDLKENLTI